MGLPKTTMVSLFWMSLFFAGNVSLNVYNKWIFSELGLKLPLFVTMTHMVVCQLGALICKFLPFVKWQPTQFTENSVLLKILTIAVFFSLNTGLNNSSLLHLNLAANQIIRATLPAITAIVSIFTEGKILSTKHYLTIVVLVFGVCMSLYKNPEFDPLGVFLCFMSTIAGAVHVTVIGNLMGCKLKMNPLDFLYYTSTPILCVLIPPFMMTDEPKLILQALDDSGWWTFTWLMGLGGFFAFFYNMVHYIFIEVTSAVYSTVAGNFKVILVIVVSFIVFKTQVEIWNGVGILVTIASFCLFSYLNFMDKAKPSAPAGDDTKAAGTETQPLKKDEEASYGTGEEAPKEEEVKA